MRKGVKAKKVVCLGMATLLAVSGIQPGMVRAEETAQEEMTQDYANVEESDWEYRELNDGTVEITGYNGSDTEVVIPVEIGGKSVTSIGGSAFSYCNGLTSIELPEGLTEIGSYAFYECSGLTSIELPEGLTEIGSNVFMKCNGLTSISIPEGVTKIGNSAFYECSGLTSIELPEGLTEIGSTVFMKCSGLTSISIPEGVTKIGNQAFYECSGLASIDLPEGLTEIGNYVFYNCSGLTSIDIPEGVTIIGESVFQSCRNLTEISVHENNIEYSSEKGVLYNKDKSKLICCPAVKKGDIDLPEGVTEIGDSAFYGCSDLTSIDIPEGVTAIGNYVFDGCSSLTSIDIPEGVTKIGNSAFDGCSSLTSIELPEGVTEIGNSAFDGCSSLTSIELPEGVTEIGYYTFAGCSSLTSIELPEGVTKIEINAFDGCSSLISIELPEGVTEIGNFTFNECSGLTSIELPEGVTKIGSAAFDRCSSLTSIDIPKGVTEIGSYAFARCSGLTSIDIPEGVTKIGERAFFGCSNLTEISVHENNIGYSSENGGLYNKDKSKLICCPAGKKGDIDLPGGVTEIESDAFYECSGLTSIALPEGITEIGDNVFYECSGLTSINLPEGVTEIGRSAFAGCSGLTSIDLPEGVTEIADVAFYRCTALTSITIPESVTTIGSSAFEYCNNLIITCTKDSVAHQYALSKNILCRVDGDYIVTFDENGGESLSQSIRIVHGEDSLGTLPVIRHNYYGFKGWYTEPVGGTLVTAETVVTEDITVYAQWNLFPDSFPLELNQWHTDELGWQETAIYKFNPEERGNYMIWVEGVSHVQIDICDESGTILENNGAEESRVWLDYAYEAGNTYYIKVYSSMSRGSYSICMMESSKFIYDELEDGSLSIKAYTGEDTNVVIPNEVNGKKVTKIGDSAFENCKAIESVEIPAGVVSIGSSAFEDCTSLERIELSDSIISIGSSIFRNCASLQVVKLPSGITKIPYYAFAYCNTLQDVEISNNVTSIKEGAFLGCEKLLRIEIPDSVTEFPYDDDFYDTPIFGYYYYANEDSESPSHANYSDMVIIGTLGSEAEGYANYNGITFESNGKKTAESLEVITLPEKVVYGICEPLVIKYSGLKVRVYFTDGTSSELTSGFTLSADTSSEGVKQVTVEYYGVTTTYEIEVSESAGLSYYELEDGTVEVDGYSGNAQSVTIPEEVEGKRVVRIDGYAFYYADSIKEIEIPLTIEDISASSKLGYKESMEEWVKIDDFKIIGYTDSAAEAYANKHGITFESCGTKMISDIAISDRTGDLKYGVGQEINSDDIFIRINFTDGSYATKNSGFTMIAPDMSTLGEKEAIISYKGFTTSLDICVYDGLEYRTKEDGTLAVDEYKGNAEKLVIPAEVDGIKVTEIDSEVFYKHTELKEVTIKEGIKIIGEYAFYGCSQLETVILPTTISLFEEKVFEGTPWLEKRRQESGVVIENQILIDGTCASGEITITEPVKIVVNRAFEESDIISVTLPADVKTIGEEAFYNCADLVSITIPEGVEKIGKEAFLGCDSLVSVTVPGTVYEIGERALGYYRTYEEVWDSYEGEYVEEWVYKTKEDFAINGMPESVAEEYALANNITFVSTGEKTIETISVYTLPNKVVYGLYDELSTEGLSIRIHFTDGSSVIRYSGFDTGRVDMTTAGEKNVSVSYKDYETSFVVTVDKTVAALPESSHDVACNETKTIYVEGAKALAITFSSQTYVYNDEDEGVYGYICIYNGKGDELGYYTERQLAGKTIVVNGDTAVIEVNIEEDEDGYASYGFKVTKVETTTPVIDVETEGDLVEEIELDKVYEGTTTKLAQDCFVVSGLEAGEYAVEYMGTNATAKTPISISVQNGNITKSTRIVGKYVWTGSDTGNANESCVPFTVEEGDTCVIRLEWSDESQQDTELAYKIRFKKVPEITSVTVDNANATVAEGGNNHWGVNGWPLRITYSDGTEQYLTCMRGNERFDDDPYRKSDDYGNFFKVKLEDGKSLYTCVDEESDFYVNAKAGDYPVTITVGEHVFTEFLTIKPVYVELDKTEMTLKESEDSEITSEYVTDGYNFIDWLNYVTWSSSDTSVVTVENGNGHGVKITAVATGTADITATTYYGRTAVCKVTVISTGDTSTEQKPTEKPSDNTGSSVGNKPSDTTNKPQTEKPTDSSTEQITTPDTVKTIQSGACEYKVTSAGTVTLTGLKKSKTKKLTIPKTITVNGTKYKVTAIADKAFKNVKITNLIVGSNIKEIGTSAFEGCKSLTKVTIGSGVTKLGKNAFKNCKKLKSITVKTVKLKAVGKNVFKGIHAKAKFKVPNKKLTFYKKMLKKAGVAKTVKII